MLRFRNNFLLHCSKADIMADFVQGHDATCPHCWETITLTLDLSVPEQSYFEDCPVCCKPIAVSYTSAEGEVGELSVEAAD
jgi:Cysteine-rich CPXCG